MWALTMSKLLLPMIVRCPSSSPRWIVTCSRTGVTGADDQSAGVLRGSYMLSDSAEDCSFEDMIVVTKRGARLDDDVGFEDAVVADGDVLLR